jgi:hypothetical protein
MYAFPHVWLWYASQLMAEKWLGPAKDMQMWRCQPQNANGPITLEALHMNSRDKAHTPGFA